MFTARGFVVPAYMTVMTDINTAAAAARENARENTGRFGEQAHSAPELALSTSDTPAPVQWTPEGQARGDFAEVYIARETNPWLQVDGQPVDLASMEDSGVEGECEGCLDGDFSGVILAMDSVDGIQRCDSCSKFDGDLEAAAHVALVLSQRTGSEHTVWFEPEAAEPKQDTVSEQAPPFVFDRNYGNYEQVRPYMADFLRVYEDVRRGSLAYNDDFIGRIPGLGAVSEKDESTGIYMLQTLRTLDIEEGKRQEFIASGGRKVSAEDIEPGQVLRGTVVKSGFYMGGTGWAVHEGIRLRVRSYPNGRRELEYVEKGKRNGSSLGDGAIYFRED